MDLSIRSAPKLEELSLVSQSLEDYVVVPDGISPGLQVLQISNVMLRSQRMEGCLVKVLVLDEVILPEESFTRFPAAFPLLEELTMSVVPFEDTTTRNYVNGVDFVALEKLSTLRLTLSTEDYFPLFLITAPMLKHLTVKDDVRFDDDGEPTYLTSTMRSYTFSKIEGSSDVLSLSE